MIKFAALIALLCVAVFAQQKGTFTDSRDGKKYKTVKIGEQTWMAENLNYNGSDGYLGLCHSERYCQVFGRLYDWSEAMGIDREHNKKRWGGSDVNHQGVCPKGWHLPSDAEWQELVDFAGGDKIAGKKLKAKDWKKENCKYTTKDDRGRVTMHDECPTDEFGFTALRGGCIDNSIDYSLGNYCRLSLGFFGYWWSASESESQYASYKTYGVYARRMSIDGINVKQEWYDNDRKSLLFSVRCVQDEAAGSNSSATQIKIDKNAIFLENKKVANTVSVIKQESLLIETLANALKNKPKSKSIAQIQIEPDINYDAFYKVMATAGYSGYTDIRFATKINGKDYTESINLPENANSPNAEKETCNFFEQSENCLNLTVVFNKDYIKIWARGGSLPIISYRNLNNEFAKKLDEEFTKTLVSIHERFIDLPDASNIVILTDDDMDVSKVILVMNKARTAGFAKMSLAKFPGSVANFAPR